jgi:hypothetical protein
MKVSIKHITLVLAAVIGLFSSVQSQDLNNNEESTHLRHVELDDFKTVQIHHDNEVIFLKSDRNRVTLAGDSSYIFNFDVVQDNQTLGLYNYNDIEGKLNIIVVEYKEMNALTASGDGTFYIHNLKEDRLNVFNPNAEVIATGYVKNIRVISQKGVTDLSKLEYKEGITHTGETAKLKKNTSISAVIPQ